MSESNHSSVNWLEIVFTSSQLEIRFDGFDLVPQDIYHQILAGNDIFREGKNGSNWMNFVGVWVQRMCVRMWNTLVDSHRHSGHAVMCYQYLK